MWNALAFDFYEKLIEPTIPKIAVFWVVAPCSLVEVYQRFRGPCCLHHTTQKTAIVILTAVRTSNPTYYTVQTLQYIGKPTDRLLSEDELKKLPLSQPTRWLTYSITFYTDYYLWTGYRVSALTIRDSMLCRCDIVMIRDLPWRAGLVTWTRDSLLLPCLQKPTIGHSPELAQSSPHFNTIPLWSTLIISVHRPLDPQVVSPRFTFADQNFVRISHCPMRATFPVHLSFMI
jgi:hypothetical protein